MKPPKRSGRRPIDPENPAVSVTFRLPLKQYNRLYQQAAESRCSLAEQVRRIVTRRAYLES